MGTRYVSIQSHGSMHAKCEDFYIFINIILTTSQKMLGHVRYTAEV
jgi:hypothetical protein